jgi:3-hydroxypropanoate dehydrogenase
MPVTRPSGPVTKGDTAMATLDDATWNQLFLAARTHQGWIDRPVDDAVLRRLYEISRMAPTALNGQPMRLVFVRSREAKARLRPALGAGNAGKTMTAPVTAIVAYDSEFHTKLARLAPDVPDAVKGVAGMEPEARRQMAQMSATLQAGYLILAARGLGLDCGPMSGFDAAKLDEEFFPDGKWKSFLLVNLGQGDPAKLNPRAPRLEFDEACQIV